MSRPLFPTWGSGENPLLPRSLIDLLFHSVQLTRIERWKGKKGGREEIGGVRRGKVDDRLGESCIRWCVQHSFEVNRIPVLGGHASFTRCRGSIGEASVIAGKVEAGDEIGCRAYERYGFPRRAARRADEINVNLSLSEVLSLLDHADDDEVLAGTSEESRRRALWQFYSTGMLTHSHSDGEFPIYSQGEFQSRSTWMLFRRGALDRCLVFLWFSFREVHSKGFNLERGESEVSLWVFSLNVSEIYISSECFGSFSLISIARVEFNFKHKEKNIQSLIYLKHPLWIF